MKNRVLKEELRREVNSMMPENMVAEIKSKEVQPKRVVGGSVTVIKEKNRHSIIPMIASCVASLVIALAVFLPIAIKSNEEYSNWLSQQQQQELEENIDEVNE